jgi:glyoxylase-like metal-dependent hydrolase (beta-lactamase superfamily II)
MTRRLNIALAALLLLLGVPYYWLLVENQPEGIAAKSLHIAELRQLAASLPGPAPSEVQMELVAFRRLPGNLFVAGAGLKRRLIGVMVFRLPVPGGAPVVIDSGLTAAAARRLDMEVFDPAAQDRVKAARRGAGTILLTHEHIDHAGGVVALGDPAVFARVRFNAAQIAGNRWTEILPWPEGERPRPSLSGTAPIAVAPGVVVIPASSHTPGSQMIYVRLAGGRELLFAGDISTLADNWAELRGRSRLVGDLIAPEDRREVFAWLRTLRALKGEAPNLDVVAGHDYEWIKFDEKLRGFTEGFRD